MITIESNIPCDTVVNNWLQLHDVQLSSLVEESRRFERTYLAWELVRQVRNPFFRVGTGFEGYFVGTHHSADEMLTTLLQIGHDMLMSNERLYRFQFSFKSTLMKTLMGEANDPQAIETWSTLLGATLGKLRCNVLFNHPAFCYQNETYWTVYRLPPISYQQCERHIEQQYVITTSKDCRSKPDFPLDLLKSSNYDAALVVLKIGRFGHPLIRAYQDEAERRHFRASSSSSFTPTSKPTLHNERV
jgi:hypothetical protein